LYWSKESIESFVFYMKKACPESEHDHMVMKKVTQLIHTIRKHQMDYIVEINKTDYGFLEGLGDSDKMEKVLASIRKKDEENHKLKRLFSKGFNSNEFHFILEFIQNADDSLYDTNVTGHLQFIYKDKKLFIQSNEKGFTFDNLYAVAGIASSDKTQSKLENKSIGEKGIGFKSIFSVCDEVLLESNGFNTKITSHFIEPMHPKELNMNTRYELNLEQFQHTIFEKYTLLTLKNIKKITFKTQERTVTYECGAKGDEFNLAHKVSASSFLFNKDDSEKFLRLKKKVDMSDIFEEKRENFESTELQLFLPYNLNNQTFKLHSFLPVSHIGLLFLVQSDFMLTQNREKTLDGNPWNQRIIQEIPNLFIESLDTLKKHSFWKTNFFKLFEKSSGKWIDILLLTKQL